MLAKQFSSPAAAEQYYLAKRSAASTVTTAASSCSFSQVSSEVQLLSSTPSLPRTTPSFVSLSLTVPTFTPLTLTRPSYTWTIPSSMSSSWNTPNSVCNISFQLQQQLYSSADILTSSAITQQLSSTSTGVSLTSSVPTTRASISFTNPKPAPTTTESTKVVNPDCCQQQTNVEQIQAACWKSIETLPPDQQCEVLSSLFDTFIQKSTTLRSVPNFIQFSVNGMNHLKQCSRSNVIYSLAKSLGTLRPDESDSLLPAKRMPMGLIEYCVNFFNANRVQQVRFIYGCLAFTYNLLHRYLAHLIIVHGWKLCMFCLAQTSRASTVSLPY